MVVFSIILFSLPNYYILDSLDYQCLLIPVLELLMGVQLAIIFSRQWQIYIYPHWDRKWISEYHPMWVFMLHETSIHSSTQTRCLPSLYDMLFKPRHAMAVFATTRWCPMHGEGHVPLPSNSQVLSPPAHTTVSEYNRSVYGCSEPHLKALREREHHRRRDGSEKLEFYYLKVP